MGEVILGRKHKAGDVVDPVDSGPVGDSGPSVPGVEVVRPVTVYLAHPYASRDIGERIEGLLTTAGITVVNPFKRPEQAEYEASMPNLSQEQCQRIVSGDLRSINAADTVVAILPKAMSVGTFMEIYHNTVVNGRVTFSLVLDDFYSEHPWIRTLTRMYTNVEDLIDELLRWPNV